MAFGYFEIFSLSFTIIPDAHQPWKDPRDCYFEHLIIHFDYLIIG